MPYTPKEIYARVHRVGALPTLPGVVTKLVNMVEEEGVSTQQVGQLISSDQVLSAKVLKIVNSAFYGFPGRIATISHALVLLGLSVVKGLVLSASVIDMMTDSMVGLWEHSVGTSAAAGHVARRIREPDPEEASVAGLLHDLGKVILSVCMKDVFAEIEAHRDARGVSMYEAERAVMGSVSHCDIGAWAAKAWNLPVRLREAMQHHHHPSKAEFEPRLAAIVHLGNAICHGLNFGFSGDRQVPPIEDSCLERLGLSWDVLPALMDDIDRTLEETDVSDLTR